MSPFMDAIKGLPDKFTIAGLARACPGVSRPMIRVIRENLRSEGKLEVIGTGRGAMWGKRDNKWPVLMKPRSQKLAMVRRVTGNSENR